MARPWLSDHRDAVVGYVIGDEAPDMAKGLFELTLVATPLIALAVAHLVGAVSFAHSGPFSPDVQQQVYLFSLVVWLLTSGRGLRPHDA